MKSLELRNKSVEELRNFVDRKKDELRNARFKLTSGKISNVSEGKKIKKDIARALSIINEKQKDGE